jgi:hypothetical protein
MTRSTPADPMAAGMDAKTSTFTPFNPRIQVLTGMILRVSLTTPLAMCALVKPTAYEKEMAKQTS